MQSVDGKDAVVIIAAVFDAFQAREHPTSLHTLLAHSPLSRLPFGEDGGRSPVREVEL